MPHRHVTCLLLLLATTPVLAQEAAPPGEPATPQESPAAAPPRTEASPQGPLSKVILQDGQELRGTVVHRDATSVQLALVSGGVITVPAASIRSIEEERSAHVAESGELYFTDPNRTRYLYSPSAMTLRQGEVYLSQKELAFTSVAVGVTDHVAILVGSAIPLWFASIESTNLILGAKVGGPVAENVHVAIGAETAAFRLLTFPQTLGLAFGTVTLGRRDAHFSLSVGKVFSHPGPGIPADLFAVSMSGNLRVAQHVALVTENWLLPSASSQVAVTANGAAVRLMAGRIAVDVGAVLLGNWSREGFRLGVNFPVPWLDFTYNFG